MTKSGWCHVTMKITLEGKEVNFDDLSEVTQEHICRSIYEGYKSIAIVEENDVPNLEELVVETEFQDLICRSFEEAAYNGRRKNIVIIDDTEIYLTYKYDDEFGEFVCWVEDEFLMEDNLPEIIKAAIIEIYSMDTREIDKRIEEGSFCFDWKPY